MLACHPLAADGHGHADQPDPFAELALTNQIERTARADDPSLVFAGQSVVDDDDVSAVDGCHELLDRFDPQDLDVSRRVVQLGDDVLDILMRCGGHHDGERPIQQHGEPLPTAVGLGEQSENLGPELVRVLSRRAQKERRAADLVGVLLLAPDDGDRSGRSVNLQFGVGLDPDGLRSRICERVCVLVVHQGAEHEPELQPLVASEDAGVDIDVVGQSGEGIGVDANVSPTFAVGVLCVDGDHLADLDIGEGLVSPAGVPRDVGLGDLGRIGGHGHDRSFGRGARYTTWRKRIVKHDRGYPVEI